MYEKSIHSVSFAYGLWYIPALNLTSTADVAGWATGTSSSRPGPSPSGIAPPWMPLAPTACGSGSAITACSRRHPMADRSTMYEAAGYVKAWRPWYSASRLSRSSATPEPGPARVYFHQRDTVLEVTLQTSSVYDVFLQFSSYCSRTVSFFEFSGHNVR
jgi:hypothetical protein